MQDNTITQNKSIAGTIILVVFGIITLFFTVTRVDTFLKNQAVNDCSHVSVYEYTNESKTTRTVTSIADVYKDCLKEKGY